MEMAIGNCFGLLVVGQVLVVEMGIGNCFGLLVVGLSVWVFSSVALTRSL